MAIHRSESNAIVSWPSSLFGFRLQSSTNLVAPDAWTDVSRTPAWVQGQSTVTNDTTLPGQFYRLISDGTF